VYVSKDTTYKDVELACGNVERVSMSVKINDEWSRLIAYYRPPNTANLNDFLVDLENSLDHPLRTIIVGDVNINIARISSTATKYIDLLASFNATIANDQITRPASSSLIDHIIVKGNFAAKNVVTVPNSESDHNMIFIAIQKSEIPINRNVITKEYIDFNLLKKNFRINSNFVASLNDTNLQTNAICQALQTAAASSKITKTFKLSRYSIVEPHFNYEILGLMRWKENIINKIRKRERANLPTSKLNAKVSSIDAKIEKASNKSAADHFEHLFSTNSLKKIWESINELIGKKKGDNIKIVKDGIVLEEESELCATFIEHFEKVSRNLDGIGSTKLDFNKYDTVKSSPTSLFITPTDEIEVARILNDLDANKAKGFDEISVKTVKTVSSALAKPLASLINNIITTAVYPVELKRGVIRPIYKREGNATDTDNYRPITILPVINKVVETILLSRIENFLEENEFFDKNQFAFRRGSGTDLAITEFLHYVNEALDKNHVVAAVFLDVKKAYDCINHELLIRKLELAGIRGLALDLFCNYLDGRTHAVRLGSSVSDFKHVDKGVGQGASLAPLLFNIATNDFGRLKIKCRVIRYADDLVLLISGAKSEINYMLSDLKVDVLTVIDFHFINRMEINPTKSHFMLIHKKGDQHVDLEELKVSDSVSIKRVKQHKYLGVIVDEYASMESQIDKLIKKVSPVINVLSILKWKVPKLILQKIYNAHFHAHLFYVPNSYAHASKASLSRLQVLQNRALKHSLKLPVLTPTIELFQQHAKTTLPVLGIAFFSEAVLLHKIKMKAIELSFVLPTSQNPRRAGDFMTQKFHSNYLKRDTSYFGVRVYNFIPKETRKLTNLESFKFKLKSFLLAKSTRFLTNDVFAPLSSS
jgi:Reverse transcriptase (RNA-dependent DNA polymerase)